MVTPAGKFATVRHYRRRPPRGSMRLPAATSAQPAAVGHFFAAFWVLSI
jgi:hypothetical protein